MLAALLPDIQRLPKSLQRVPAGTERGFVAGHVQWKKLYWTILQAFSYAGGRKARTLDELKAEANKGAGFDIDANLLEHVATDVLILDELAGPDQAPQIRRHDGDGLCFVFRIKDDAAFATAYAKLLAQMHVRKQPTFERGGVTIQPIRFLGRGEHVARTDGHVFYALGERGLAALSAYVGRAARPSGETAKSTLPESLRRVENQAPPGFNLAGLIPLRFFAGRLGGDVLWKFWRELHIRRTSRAKLRTDIESMLPILEKYRLDHWFLLGGFEPRKRGGGSARIRLVW